MMSATLRNIRWAAGLLGILAGLLGHPSGLRAQMPQPISVIVFPGGFNWPIWVAQQKGYFAQNGIEVKLTNTRTRCSSSPD
jgi:ABC-type nitrate/sulfonate/bicarbonate transport system substrate-binding protein